MSNPQKRRFRELRDSFDEKKESINQQIIELTNNYKILEEKIKDSDEALKPCLLYTSPSPRDRTRSRMPSSA